MFREEKRGVKIVTAVLIIAVTAAAIGGSLYLLTQFQSSAPEKCNLTVSTEGTGHVEFEPEGGVYEKGTEVTVRAFPPPGGGFKGWTGDVSEDSSTITVVMNSNKHLVAHFSSDGAFPEVKYPSAAELSESGPVWDSSKVWVNFNRTSMSWSLHEKTTACNPHEIKENLVFWKDNATVKFRKVFTLYTCAENGYLWIEPAVKENNVLLLKVHFDADTVCKCVSKFWLTGTIERFAGRENVPSELENIEFRLVNEYTESVDAKVSKDTVKEVVEEYPGTMTPGMSLVFEPKTVEIVSVEFMTGREWNEKFFYESKISTKGMMNKPAENRKFWVVKYTGQARIESNVPTENYHKVTMWRACDALTGELTKFWRFTSQETSDFSKKNVNFESSLENLNLSGASAEKTSSLVDGANKFAFELYSRLAEENNNSFLSPYSIHAALAMTYEGAKGRTAEEMELALNLPVDDNIRLPAFADLHEKLNSNRTVELKTANALWPQENFPFYENYLKAVKKHYLARLKSLDFASDSDAAVERINEWAAKHTENKIEQVLQRLDPRTVLVLTNAIYFKGAWLIPFDESRTENEPFHLPDGSTVQVPMMQFHENRLVENKFCYAETSELKALKLPYTGKEMSMIFLLSKNRTNGIDWLKEHVTKEEFGKIQDKFDKEMMGEIEIPKFEFKVKYKEELKKILKNMGIQSAFISGNFTGMSPYGAGLYITKVVHKAYIKVNERGTEAAAVTVVPVAGARMTSFIADHPFMFLIKDEKTGSILFIGGIVNPSSG